jgi:hypothetical protein
MTTKEMIFEIYELASRFVEFPTRVWVGQEIKKLVGDEA